MKITSRAGDYALLLLMELTELPPEKSTSVKKAALKLHLSLRFLANIANKLSMARILVSNRGINGGIRLARSADRISVGEAIEAVDGPVQTMFCQNTHDHCIIEPLCHMKFFWDDLQGTVMTKLSQTTIADLVTKKISGGSPPRPITQGSHFMEEGGTV